MLNETIHVDGGFLTQHILRTNEDVFYERGRNYSQRYLAINAAEGEVIDFVSERRNVSPLAGIDIHRKDVFSVKINVRSQIERERRVSAFVFAETCAIDPNSGSGHHSFEVNKYVLTSGLNRQFEATSIERDEFISL